ncbi:hypothetical protein M9434_003730 [Picochlorum sp. BPE23]|nr:hypothetical protein M9434_003730 [Picochlorum sp. BPE23]
MYPCLLTRILGHNRAYHDIAIKAITSYMSNFRRRVMHKQSKTTTPSTTGSGSSKDTKQHDFMDCSLLADNLLNLVSDLQRLSDKRSSCIIKSIARQVYSMLYVNRDNATPDLPSHLKCTLMIDM